MTIPTQPQSPVDSTHAMNNRRELALPGLLLGGALTVGAFAALLAVLNAVPSSHNALPDYPDWASEVPHELVARLQWLLGDITEPQFYKSWVASLGLLAGATVGWWALRAKKRWAGEPIAYGTGLWPWMLGAAGLSLVLSNALFGGSLDSGWQPTFVPFVCVATSVILVYGRGWTKLLTGAILGAFTTPLAMVLIDHVTGPLSLPPVVANTTSMSIGAALTFLLCRALPWMRRPTSEPESQEETVVAKKAAPTLLGDTRWMIRRIITDFTETQFYANEWASIGLIVGAIVTTVLNPSFASYGTGLLPKIMLAQALTSAIGIIIWRHLYRDGGWAPTYISVVSVAPATVLAHGNSVTALVLGAMSGAVLCPVIARPISKVLPDDFHPFIGNTVSMAISTAVIVPTIGHLV
ncbi:hypothetical protein M2283_009391 [Streptomyces pseudovenezuelae]|uniref:Integral membrane protein n=2 Tax=Streptomyces pseudovenezuelae TaxID=67350 RepID=A0ABT6M322_9ACTN|nr:hypothetical protein [Streptomyces pseudovenezuelae]